MKVMFRPRAAAMAEARSASRGPWRFIASLTLLLCLLALASVALGAGGALDPTFDGDGRVVTDFGFGAHEDARDVAIQADGKIVAAGSNVDTFGLTRYTPDGSLDPSFDGDGRVVTIFGRADFANAVAIQANGKIVAAGATGVGSNPPNFALARYNLDGSLDPTFDGDGMVVTDFGFRGRDFAEDVAIQADGKIVAAGGTGAGARPRNFALARYNLDGSLDQSFDGDGRVITDFVAGDAAFGVAIQPDSKIVAAGFTGNPADFALARYNADGGLDSSFDGDGRVVTNVGLRDFANAVRIQADGKIVAAGTSRSGANYFALARYTRVGQLDSTFDADGMLLTDFGGEDSGEDLELQADGRIVVAGRTRRGDRADFALARYNLDGTLDATFDADGMVVTDFGGDYDNAFSVAIQTDGKIVAAGGTYNSERNDTNFAVTRYLPGPPGPPDHFLDYSIGPGTPAFEPRTVTVRDQFRTSQARVVEPLRLLVPASKDGGRINRPDAHLKCYRIEEPRFDPRTVSVDNEFGAQTLRVGQPRLLCNPASKRVPPGTPPPVPSGLGHFRCYGAGGSSLNRAVTLRDQFGTQQVTVEEPDYLCNPASKNGSPIVRPARHLVCYELGSVDPFTPRRASLRDQFGVQTFSVVRPTKLCVPSSKSP